MSTPVRELVVPRRYCGPPGSGNGGWVSGSLAGLLADLGGPVDAVTVTLRVPPPLEEVMEIRPDGDGGVVAALGETVVATAERSAGRAEPADEPVDEPVDIERVDAETARAAEARFAGHAAHPFDTCFVCGTAREPGDGLRIFPGLVGDTPPRVAATWTPHPSLAEDYHAYDRPTPCASLAVAWAALDCVGGWAGDLGERRMVLGRMTGSVHRLPVLGERHVVTGVGRGTEGRKTFTASALHDSSGALVGRAEHVWISV